MLKFISTARWRLPITLRQARFNAVVRSQEPIGLGRGQLKAKLNIQETWATSGERVQKLEDEFLEKISDIRVSIETQLPELVEDYLKTNK